MAQVGALVWLRLVLMARRMRTGAGALPVISQVLTLLFVMGFAFAVYCAQVTLFRALPRPQATELLHTALTAIWWIWVIAPLVGMSFDDSTDLSRLMSYPITAGRLTCGILAADLVCAPAGIAALLAAPVGWAQRAPQAPLMLAAIGLLALHLVALVESLRVLLWDLLRSRRMRDLAIVLSPLAVLLAFAIQGSLMRGDNLALAAWAKWQRLHPSTYLQFWPSGLAASVITSAAGGRYSSALIPLAALGAVAGASVALFAALVRHVQAGEAGAAGAMRTRARRRARERPARRRRWTPWSAAVATMAAHELLLFRRSPHLKTRIIHIVLFPIAWLGFVAVHSFGGGPLPFAFSVGLMLLATMGINIFGLEGRSLHSLFLYPVSRRAILAAKNLAWAVALMALYVPALVALAVISGQVRLLPMTLAIAAATLPMVFAVSNLIAIHAPYAMPTKRANPFAARGPGCLIGLLHMLGLLAAVIAAAPIIAALVLPTALHRELWYALAVPAAAVYGWAMYNLLLNVAARQLLAREPEIIAAVVVREE